MALISEWEAPEFKPSGALTWWTKVFEWANKEVVWFGKVKGLPLSFGGMERRRTFLWVILKSKVKLGTINNIFKR